MSKPFLKSTKNFSFTSFLRRELKCWPIKDYLKKSI